LKSFSGAFRFAKAEQASACFGSAQHKQQPDHQINTSSNQHIIKSTHHQINMLRLRSAQASSNQHASATLSTSIIKSSNPPPLSSLIHN
jgi:hypothetical protein